MDPKSIWEYSSTGGKESGGNHPGPMSLMRRTAGPRQLPEEQNIPYRGWGRNGQRFGGSEKESRRE